jgi:SCY1-like protein 1
MFARLTALVGSGGGLPFEVGEAHPSAWGQWAHFKGTLKADGSPVSVFRVSAPSANDPKLRAARNGVKRLRTVRRRAPPRPPPRCPHPVAP